MKASGHRASEEVSPALGLPAPGVEALLAVWDGVPLEFWALARADRVLAVTLDLARPASQPLRPEERTNLDLWNNRFAPVAMRLCAIAAGWCTIQGGSPLPRGNARSTAREIHDLARALGVVARHRIEAGNLTCAGECLQALLVLARATESTPDPSGLFLRLALRSQVCRGVERALAQSAPGPDWLEPVQSRLECEAGFPALHELARHECQTLERMAQDLESGRLGLADLLGPFDLTTGRMWSNRNWPFSLLDTARAQLPRRSKLARGLRLAGAWLREAGAHGQEAGAYPQVEWRGWLDQREAALKRPGIANRTAYQQTQLFAASVLAAHRSSLELSQGILSLASARFRQNQGRWPLEFHELETYLGGTFLRSVHSVSICNLTPDPPRFVLTSRLDPGARLPRVLPVPGESPWFGRPLAG